jgi:hypothetical protein
LKNARRLL